MISSTTEFDSSLLSSDRDEDSVSNGEVGEGNEVLTNALANSASKAEETFSQTVPKVERVSVTSDGSEVLGFASSASLSGDGRFVAFSETADGLVPDDVNGVSDIFVRDRITNTTERLSAALASTADDAESDSNAFPSYNPVISDNGQAVAFETFGKETSSIFLYSRDTDTVELISASATGEAGNGSAKNVDISADARFVVFQSDADNLVADDTNQASDIFLRDRLLNTIESVSLAADSTQSNGNAGQASISADGRYIAFTSTASNLVENDTNETADIFVYDRQLQTTERISVATDGTQSDGFSRAPSISADGRYVSYDSMATNLVADDTNKRGDVFVFDRETQTTTRVSLSTEGVESNNFSFNHDISGEGRYVTYSSAATNLVEQDTNRVRDVFVFDRETQTTTRLSVNADGVQGNRESRESTFSADGRFIAYQSSADILVDDDTNGRTDIFVYDFQPPAVSDSERPEDSENNAVILDLTAAVGETVQASIEVVRDAGYNNTVGWYAVADRQGGVKDALTGEILKPGDEGYTQAALSQRLDISLTGTNGETIVYEAEIAAGSLLSTFIVSNGTIEALLDTDTTNDPNIFFGHMGANSDGVEHVKMLDENVFGYEDLFGGGDNDFDDLVVRMSFN